MTRRTLTNTSLRGSLLRTTRAALVGASLCPLIGAALAASIGSDAHAQVRIVNYNIAKLAGDANALRATFAEMAQDNKPGFAVAPAILAFQEVRNADLAALQTHIAAAFPGVPYVRATFTTSGTEDGAGGGQCVYYRNDLLDEVVASHVDIPTGASRNSDRWLFTLDGYTSAAARFYVYSSHLKASNTSGDAAERNTGAQALRNNANALGAGQHIIFLGDYNLYTNSEAAYATMTAAGNAQCFDPLGSADWVGSSGALKHTQSPRDVTGTLVGGGCDDRFDFQLSTAEVQDGDGFALIPGTYRTFGNDGSHYNLAINAGNNFYYPGDVARSNMLADVLFDASDHLPVVADYQVPPIMQVTSPATFGPVIRNATGVTVAIAVSNAANVVHPLGVEPLAASVVGSTGLTGSQSITAALAPSSTTVNLAVNTATAGAINGTATVTTTVEGAQNATIVRTVSGTVLVPSNPSFSLKANATSTTATASFGTNTGIQEIQVPVYNRGYTAAMARLDIDGATSVASPFAAVDVTEANVGAAATNLRFSFDTTGRAPGTYTQSVTINTSDENLPGAASRTLALTLSVTVTGSSNPADFDGDGDVDAADLATLLSQWGTAGSADISGNGIVGPEDLAELLGSWG
jgi:endonuclease/exonuclease/phosphatase family metal-dependent hydrolase